MSVLSLEVEYIPKNRSKKEKKKKRERKEYIPKKV